MEFITELWIPIAVSAVFVWIASAIIHMVLPFHKAEWNRIQNEDQVLDMLRSSPPGQYMFPFCTMAELNTPEYKEKIAKGPIGVVTIWSGPTNMGKNLGLTLLFFLVVGVFVAYVAWHALGKGAEYMTVFRIAGTAAFMAHGLGWMPNMIWYGGKGFWSYLFDSLVYALITAGTFGWLWAR